jgi:DNA-binding GntR family transcriptional regulator
VLEEQMKYIVDEHAQIIAAIRRKDRDRLTDLLVSHAQRAQDRLIARIGASRGADFSMPSRGSRRTPG